MTGSNPLVSIILPTYNRAGLLPNAIDSVLDQTYKNWELIIWDDGSTDNTAAIVKSYHHEKIRYFHNDNHGMSYALNNAINETHAEYIAFIDDDDSWSEFKLETQMEIMTKNSFIDMVFGNYLNVIVEPARKEDGFSQNKRAMSNLQTSYLGNNAFVIVENFLPSIALENFIAFDTVIIRKSAFANIGFFNEDLRNGMDFEYWWRLGLAKKTPAYTEKIVLIRNKYSAGLSSLSLLSIKNHLKTLDSCTDYNSIKNRNDANDLLNSLYRNDWQNLITAYGQQKNLSMAFHAFKQSLAHGFRPGSVRLLMQAIFGTLISD